MPRTLPGDHAAAIAKVSKPPVKPVTVKVTKSARKANIPVQRAVTEINQAVGTKVVRTTKSRKKADVVVKTGAKKWGEAGGYAARTLGTGR